MGPGSLRAALAVFVVVACTEAVRAEPSPALDRVSVWLGGSNLDTRATLQSNSRSGRLSTGKLDLGKGNQAIVHARLDLLLFDAQGFSFDYYGLSRVKRRSYEGRFDYEGIPFDLAASLRSRFDIDLGSAAWHWWFGSDRDVVGVGLGGAWYRARLGLHGRLAIAGETIDGAAKWSESATAPVVTIAYRHAFSQAFRVYADANGLKKNGGPLSGHLYNLRAGAEWFPRPNVGIGAEYGHSRVSLRHERTSFDSRLDIDFQGPSLFARLRY